ncbi:MAG: MFS transporter [Halodesulfurarchaeum sp.]
MTPGTMRDEAGRLRVFGSLCVMVFLVNFGRVVFAPLLDPFIRIFGVGEATAGLVATLAWFGSAVPRLPTGYLLTRVRRHRVVLATGILLSVSAGLTALADTIWTIGLGAFFIGTTSGAYFIAANPLVSELFPDRVGRVIGVHGMAAQLAAVFAPLSIGAILLVSSWRVVFVGLSVVALVATIALYHTARRTDLPDIGTRNRHLRRSVRNQWPIVLTAVAVVGVTGFVWNGFFNFFVRYLTTAKDVDFQVAQSLLTVIFAAGVPAFFLTGRLADRVRHVALMLSILGGFILTLVAMTIVRGLVGITIVAVVMGYVIHSMFPAVDTYLLDSLPDADRSSAYSAYSATMMLIQAGASVVVGTLIQRGLTFDFVYRVFAGVLIVVFVVLAGLQWSGRLPDTAR